MPAIDREGKENGEVKLKCEEAKLSKLISMLAWSKKCNFPLTPQLHPPKGDTYLPYI
jgi:hypothetical protein